MLEVCSRPCIRQIKCGFSRAVNLGNKQYSAYCILVWLCVCVCVCSGVAVKSRQSWVSGDLDKSVWFSGNETKAPDVGCFCVMFALCENHMSAAGPQLSEWPAS